MKTVAKIGLYGLSTGLALFIAGCQTQIIEADYVMPARKVTDVSKVNVVSLKVNAKVNGNMAGKKAMNEQLIRQMLSARLYKGGYYRVTDDIWGSEEAPDKIAAILEKANESGHGYASYSSGGQVAASELCPKCGTICDGGRHKDTPQGMKVKARLVVDVKMDLNTEEVTEEKSFDLAVVPYQPVKTKEGMPPTSAPNLLAAQKTTQKVPVKVFKTVAKGTVTARFEGLDGKDSPVKYENTFKLPIVKVEKKVEGKKEGLMSAVKDAANAALSKKPEEDLTNLASPSQLDALAEVLSPAIAEIIADISPYTEKRRLVAIEGGDERVVTLLNARAFDEVVAFVTELARTGKAGEADLENMGIALEAAGKFELAKKAFKKALKLNPEKPSETAKAGLARVEKMLAGNEAIKASGAKKNADTQFKAAK